MCVGRPRLVQLTRPVASASDLSQERLAGPERGNFGADED